MPRILLLLALLLCVCLPVVCDLAAADRLLVNPDELRNEIKAAPGTAPAAKEHFPSFLEYQDLIMFHPRFGYYGSGRVNFWGDYQTFPIVLSPYFGQMISEQIFRMWQGMRQAGSLGPKDTFTIAEFGAGDGTLAESILDYLERQAQDSHNKEWHDFAAQTVYACYDRSPALSKAQRERNARFGRRFEAREADATNLTASIAPNSLKGVVLSNELPDAFSVHKVILSADGSAEVAFVVPSLANEKWQTLAKQVSREVATTVNNADQSIRARFFAGKTGVVYLNRAAFVGLLEALTGKEEYEPAVNSLQFNELYLPGATVPELGDHLRRYAALYASELAKSDAGVVTYINPGVERFIQGAGRILNVGYVMTIDYGCSWEGIMAQRSYPHLRTYGPAHRQDNTNANNPDDNQAAGEHETSDPYSGPTLNDLTTDVNFSLMEAEGRLVGLKSVYFGPQSALQTGTRISLQNPPGHREGNDELVDEFMQWAESFQSNGNYKVMVQQKEKTDPAYAYPEKNPEPLTPNPSTLTPQQKQRAAEIAKKLSGEAAALRSAANGQ